MVVPDPGGPLQLVHQDDMATAIAAAAVGRGEPGAYNIAGEGTVTFGEVATALGAVRMPVPHAAATIASEVVAKLPWVPALAEWIHVARTPVIMDTSRAKALLGWQPEHTAEETLAAMADAVRARSGR
jgi:nucleoside-diphosphate-sugar epimerase